MPPRKRRRASRPSRRCGRGRPRARRGRARGTQATDSRMWSPAAMFSVPTASTVVTVVVWPFCGPASSLTSATRHTWDVESAHGTPARPAPRLLRAFRRVLTSPRERDDRGAERDETDDCEKSDKSDGCDEPVDDKRATHRQDGPTGLSPKRLVTRLCPGLPPHACRMLTRPKDGSAGDGRLALAHPLGCGTPRLVHRAATHFGIARCLDHVDGRLRAFELLALVHDRA